MFGKLYVPCALNFAKLEMDEETASSTVMP